MDYWSVLNYEIQMYFGTRHLQGFPIPSTDHNLIILQTSAMTEVKALHIRILTDMFLGTQFKDDIKIEDFIPDWRLRNMVVADNLDNAYNTNLEIGESPRNW